MRGDVARLGETICDASFPIGEAFVLVNDDDRGRFVFHLGKDDERFDLATFGGFDFHPFVVAGSVVETFLNEVGGLGPR